jgi:ubiquinol-cytochrome c reductase cytochrome c1 subunit
LGRIAVIYYFAYFLVILPLLPRFEKTKPVPLSIADGVKYVIPLCALLMAPSALAAGAAVPLPKEKWSFQGPLGTFERDAVQRGLEVYKSVCSSCHSLSHVRYGKLEQIGLSEEEVKAFAKGYEVPGPLSDDGEPTKKPATPADSFANPYPNSQAARASNNGAYPGDLSLIVKARKGGADYLYHLLLGYEEAPKDITLSPGMHYNKYFPGYQIAMAKQLHSEGQVTYADGTKATIEQMARDVTTFLAWAAEPEMETRKRTGVMVLIFLATFTIMMYFVMNRIWRRVKYVDNPSKD